jgi:hypothetical protein
MRRDEDGPSLSDLMATALTQLSLLAQTEIRLARAEIGQKVSAAGVGIGLIGLGGIIAIPGLVLLLTGMAVWMSQHGWSAVAADVIVGVGALVVTVALLSVGLSRLRFEALKPRRTLAQFQRDAAVAKDHLT